MARPSDVYAAPQHTANVALRVVAGASSSVIQIST